MSTGRTGNYGPAQQVGGKSTINVPAFSGQEFIAIPAPGCRKNDIAQAQAPLDLAIATTLVVLLSGGDDDVIQAVVTAGAPWPGGDVEFSWAYTSTS